MLVASDLHDRFGGNRPPKMCTFGELEKSERSKIYIFFFNWRKPLILQFYVYKNMPGILGHVRSMECQCNQCHVSRGCMYCVWHSCPQAAEAESRSRFFIYVDNTLVGVLVLPSLGLRNGTSSQLIQDVFRVALFILHLFYELPKSRIMDRHQRTEAPVPSF